MDANFNWIAELKTLTEHYKPEIAQLVISGIVLLLYAVLSRRIAPFIYRTIAATMLKEEMNRRAMVVFHILLFLLLVVVLSIIWGIDIKGLLVLASSMIAVVGVAFTRACALYSAIFVKHVRRLKHVLELFLFKVSDHGFVWQNEVHGRRILVDYLTNNVLEICSLTNLG